MPANGIDDVDIAVAVDGLFSHEKSMGDYQKAQENLTREIACDCRGAQNGGNLCDCQIWQRALAVWDNFHADPTATGEIDE